VKGIKRFWKIREGKKKKKKKRMGGGGGGGLGLILSVKKKGKRGLRIKSVNM
jgi:hypothetical protein